MSQRRPDFYLGTEIDGVHLNAEQLNVRSINLNELIGRLTYTEALFHILQGREPTDQERKLFDLVLVAFHGGFGLLPPTTLVPRLVAGTGVTTAQAMAAGYLASGPYHVGAVEQAMKLYTAIANEFRASDRESSTAGDLEQFAYENAKARLQRGETIGGFGHPLLRRDPRPVHIRRAVCELNAAGPFFDVFDGVSRCLQEMKGVPPNVDGVTGAILLHLGLLPEHGTGLFLLARSAAMLAHIVEEQTEMPYQTMRRFMLLPVVLPRLFNADFKKLTRRFNHLRDSKAFTAIRNTLKGGVRKARRKAAEKEQADLAAIEERRNQRNSAALDASFLTAPARDATATDDFVSATGDDLGPPADDSDLAAALLEDCSSPELLAGAALFLSSCLQSLPDDESGSSQTGALVNAALGLVQQASEAAKSTDP
jgi:hypothetical protein